MNDRLLALKVFVRIAYAGSYEGTRLSQPSVSRVLAALERDLGVQLLIRTTRTLELTRAGKDYLARVEPPLAILEAAGHAVREKGNCAAFCASHSRPRRRSAR
jgi:DNA-binding transcriptional LysR family regulator